jgi:hypothetical protein
MLRGNDLILFIVEKESSLRRACFLLGGLLAPTKINYPIFNDQINELLINEICKTHVLYEWTIG